MFYNYNNVAITIFKITFVSWGVCDNPDTSCVSLEHKPWEKMKRIVDVAQTADEDRHIIHTPFSVQVRTPDAAQYSYISSNLKLQIFLI